MISYCGNCRYIKTEEQPLTMKCKFCKKEKPTSEFKHTIYKGRRVQSCNKCADLLRQNLSSRLIYKRNSEETYDDEWSE